MTPPRYHIDHESMSAGHLALYPRASLVEIALDEDFGVTAESLQKLNRLEIATLIKDGTSDSIHEHLEAPVQPKCHGEFMFFQTNSMPGVQDNLHSPACSPKRRRRRHEAGEGVESPTPRERDLSRASTASPLPSAPRRRSAILRPSPPRTSPRTNSTPATSDAWGVPTEGTGEIHRRTRTRSPRTSPRTNSTQATSGAWGVLNEEDIPMRPLTPPRAKSPRTSASPPRFYTPEMRSAAEEAFTDSPHEEGHNEFF